MKEYTFTVPCCYVYTIEAKNEKQARQNYKDGEEGDYTCLEEMVVEVEQLEC